jgi:hypothetical protein
MVELVSKVIALDEQRPHLVCKYDDGSTHVIPIQMLHNVLSGNIKITDIDGYKDLFKHILYE